MLLTITNKNANILIRTKSTKNIMGKNPKMRGRNHAANSMVRSAKSLQPKSCTNR